MSHVSLPYPSARLGFAEGEVARVSSRRGSQEAPVHIDETIRPTFCVMIDSDPIPRLPRRQVFHSLGR